MNLHLLRMFLIIATEQNFSRAAERLHISQPAVSKGLISLERQLGLVLLDRSRSTVTLTEAGRILLRHAQAIFAEERAAEAAMSQVRELTHGHLAVGASSTIGSYLLPPLLAAYHRLYPEIAVSLEIGNTHELLHQLRTTPLDAILVEGPIEAPDLTIRPWREDELIVIAPPHHPLHWQQRIPGAAISTYLVLLRETGSGTREVIDAHLQKYGIHLGRTMEIGHTEAIKRLVAEDVGIGIIPAVTCQDDVANGHLVQLDIPELVIPRALWYITVTNRPIAPAHLAFQHILHGSEKEPPQS